MLHATHILSLFLNKILDFWYTSVSPEAMATWLAALPKLENLYIKFRSPLPNFLRTTLPARMHSVLPALTLFEFKGVSEYLEGLIARIDPPHLAKLRIAFFMELIFDVPQLSRFIGRTGRLRSIPLSYSFLAMRSGSPLDRHQLVSGWKLILKSQIGSFRL